MVRVTEKGSYAALAAAQDIVFLQDPSQLLHYITGHIYRRSRQTVQIILIPEYREEP